MKKVFCDICGNEIKDKYALINLPYKFGGYVKQSRDEDDASDLCLQCALELYSIIDKFKKEKKTLP